MVPFFHCSRVAGAAAMGFSSPCIGMQRQRRIGQGAGGRAGGGSRSSEGTRVSAFPSKCRHLSNVISEMILLNQESVKQGCGAQPPPGSSQAQPSATAGGGRRLLLPWPRSLPLPRSQPPARPGLDTQQPRGGGPGARDSERPPRPVLGLPPVGRGRGKDRGYRGDARLRAELKAVRVSLCVCSIVCVYACARGGGGLDDEGRGRKQGGKEEEREKNAESGKMVTSPSFA